MATGNEPKISCILTSYNRPTLIRQSLKGVADQTWRNFELIVLDESTLFDICAVVSEFKFPEIIVVRYFLDNEKRRQESRLSIKANDGIRIAKGDLVCFTCDDDYFHPEWFKHAARYFQEHGKTYAAYGRLFYSGTKEMVFPTTGKQIFPNAPIPDPHSVLDHNQVMHRRLKPPVFWPEEIEHAGGPDATYFRRVAARCGPMMPINAFAAVKREHEMSFHKRFPEILRGIDAKELRE